MTMTGIAMKSKVVPVKDLGDASRVKSLPPDQSRLVLGVVFGEINRLVERTNPTGDKYQGFGGTFEARPSDANSDVIRSGVLYLPAAFFDALAQPFNAMRQTDADARLHFGFEVAAVKDTNPEGYVYEFLPLGEPIKCDPLAAVRGVFNINDSHEASQTAEAPKAQTGKSGKKR